MALFLPFIWVFIICLHSSSAQIYFPGPENVYLEIHDEGIEIQSMGEFPVQNTQQRNPQIILVTDHIRSLQDNGSWIDIVEPGDEVIAPVKEKDYLSDISKMWSHKWDKHFHDYENQSNDILTRNLPVTAWVDNTFRRIYSKHDIVIECLNTPGPTRGSVSYLISHRPTNKKYLYSGNLVFNQGKILELYRFQDAIPEAGLRGYHGFAGRLAQLVGSIRHLQDIEFDVHISSEGKISSPKGEVLEIADQKCLSLYSNYLSSSALHWYFGEKFIEGSYQRLASDAPSPPIPNFSNIKDAPTWCWSIGTTRILHSSSGRVILIDCGSPRVLEFVDAKLADQTFTGVDGIFVTHYHDDHTDFVDQAAAKYQCPVYALSEYADVLKNPEAYRLPCLTQNPITKVQSVEDLSVIEWEEFRLTFRYFPGQTWFHGAVLVHLKKDPRKAVLFGGDAFTPSGIDDYCLWNRNLLVNFRDTITSQGYFRCLEILQSYNQDLSRKSDIEFYVANQHVEPIFEVRSDTIMLLNEKLSDRVHILHGLMQPATPGIGVDPYWFTLYPYLQEIKQGDIIRLKPLLRLESISPMFSKAVVTIHFPESFHKDEISLTVDLNKELDSGILFKVPQNLKAGTYPITSTVRLINKADNKESVFRHYTECILRIAP